MEQLLQLKLNSTSKITKKTFSSTLALHFHFCNSRFISHLLPPVTLQIEIYYEKKIRNPQTHYVSLLVCCVCVLLRVFYQCLARKVSDTQERKELSSGLARIGFSPCGTDDARMTSSELSSELNCLSVHEYMFTALGSFKITISCIFAFPRLDQLNWATVVKACQMMAVFLDWKISWTSEKALRWSQKCFSLEQKNHQAGGRFLKNYSKGSRLVAKVYLDFLLA